MQVIYFWDYKAKPLYISVTETIFKLFSYSLYGLHKHISKPVSEYF